MDRGKSIFKSFDWFFVLSVLTIYTLGSFVARNTGKPWNLLNFFCGLGIVYGLYSLERIYNFLSTSKLNIFTIVGRSEKLKEPYVIGLILFAFSIIFIAVYLLVRAQVLIGINLIWLLVITVLVLLPVNAMGRVWNLSYGWIMKSLIISPFTLFLGSSLQEVAPFPLLSLMALHLFLLYATSAITLQFSTYQENQDEQHPSFIGTVGWERAIEIHNVLILLAYLVLISYIFRSGSWQFNWPALGIVILSIFEIYLLRRLAEGLKPNWPLLNSVAFFQFNGMVYILAYALLIH